MKTISRDLSTEIKATDDFYKRAQELLKEFLNDLAPKIEKLPVTINISVEAGKTWWRFVAEINEG